MNLQYIGEEDVIMALDTLFEEYAADPSLYSSVEMTATLNCNNYVVQEYPTSTIQDTSHLFYLENDAFIVTQGMFPGTFTDGIYRVDIKLKTTTGFTRVYNCIFIDDTFKCRLASLLASLLDGDDTSAMAHLIHYSLVNGSNCGCECDEMCSNFDALKTILDNQPVQATDCGCK